MACLMCTQQWTVFCSSRIALILFLPLKVDSLKYFLYNDTKLFVNTYSSPTCIAGN